MQVDLSIFERVPVQDLIQMDNNCNECSDSSDKDSVQSDKNDYLSDEEVKNKYTFLATFKKRRGGHKRKSKHPPRPLCVKEDVYQSE